MYIINIDIPFETPWEQINEFAESHGCMVVLKELEGPNDGSPVYEFSSNNFNYIHELVEQYFGGEFDEEEIKNMIVEV